MGFLDFLKRRKEETKEKEKVAFGNLDSWIGNKSSEVEQEKKVFLGLMKNRTSKLVEELRQGIETLGKLNWEKIKAEERLKMIVKENLGNYVMHLEQLASDLESLEETDRVREKIDSVFSMFDKKTRMNYQKSTILIGKELENINNIAGNFFKDLDKVQKDNKDLIDNLKVISIMKEKLKELQETERMTSDTRKTMEEIEKTIKESENEINNIEKEIEEIKKTDEYLGEERKREKLESDKEKLKKEVYELRGLIDFKYLAGMWHENKIEMNIVKEHKVNFQKAFEKNGGESIMGVIRKSSINIEPIDEVYSRINKLGKEIESVNLGKELTFDSEEKIRKRKEGIEKLNERKEKEEKRIRKLEVEREKIVTGMKTEMEQIGVEVE